MRGLFEPLNFLAFPFKTIPQPPSATVPPLPLGKFFEAIDFIDENFSVLARKSGTLRI